MSGTTPYEDEAVSGGATELNELTDVTISGTPNDNDALAYDTATGKFIPQALAGGGGVSVLNDLTDVTITGTPDGGSILTYDSTSSVFVNNPDVTVVGAGADLALSTGDIKFDGTGQELNPGDGLPDAVKDITSASRQVTDTTVDLVIQDGLSQDIFAIDKTNSQVVVGDTPPTGVTGLFYVNGQTTTSGIAVIDGGGLVISGTTLTIGMFNRSYRVFDVPISTAQTLDTISVTQPIDGSQAVVFLNCGAAGTLTVAASMTGAKTGYTIDVTLGNNETAILTMVSDGTNHFVNCVKYT